MHQICKVFGKNLDVVHWAPKALLDVQCETVTLV
jgi:hypothetical protein